MIQQAANAVKTMAENPKAGMGMASAGVTSWIANFWSWLPANIGVAVGIVSIIVGFISAYNQLLQIRLRRRALKNGTEDNS